MDEFFIVRNPYDFEMLGVLEAVNGKKFISFRLEERETYYVSNLPFQEELKSYRESSPIVL